MFVCNIWMLLEYIFKVMNLKYIIVIKIVFKRQWSCFILDIYLLSIIIRFVNNI